MNHSVRGVLLLYHHPLAPGASTVLEHARSFERWSRFPVYTVNTELGFLPGLASLRFEAIVLHYSLFGTWPYELKGRFLEHLGESRSSYKVAFFQDEHRFCEPRFDFLRQFQIDCVYTLLEPAHWQDTYRKYSRVPRLVYNLPGYVSETLVAAARRLTLTDDARPIDIGYRGRKLEYYMGRGGLEKSEIGIRFRQMAAGSGLKLEIEVEERQRLYGEAWYRFLASCRAVLGVEAGVSIFDVEDLVYPAYQRLVAANPRVSFAEMSKQLRFQEYEDKIHYRTISPRHFEAAAFRVCQILFEGAYARILRPLAHYIPLKKDFSNFAEVLHLFGDRGLRQQITEKAYQELIASEQYSYKEFIGGFDRTLLDAGLGAAPSPEQVPEVRAHLSEDAARRKLYALVRGFRYRPFPGKSALAFLLRPLARAFRPES